VTIADNNVDAIQSMILANQRIFVSAKMIPETLVISKEKVGYSIQKISEMRKLSAKGVPKYHKADQKCDRGLLHKLFWTN
jgi:hypothetical protein